MAGSLASLTKYKPPLLPRLLKRNRLIKRLRANLDKNLWLIIGQAAQGKTTLISSWVEVSPSPTVWLKLEPEDAPIERLFLSLANALAFTTGGSPDPLISQANLTGQPLTSPPQLAYLARLIYENSPPGAEFVLDGLDLLPSDAPALDLIQALIESLPVDRRLILLSRHRLPGQDELIIQRQAMVLDNEDLACTQKEVSDFVELMTGRKPQRGQVRTIQKLCEGWLGGIVLCCETMKELSNEQLGPSPQSDATDQAREGFYHFFGRNIFDQLDQRKQDFLLACAPFKVLDARVMAMLAQEDDARDILEDLCLRHLFIKPLMDEQQGRVYRLHQLFREFLSQRYREKISQAQHRFYMARAGHILEEEGYGEEALTCHLEAQQYIAAASLIKRLAPQMVRTGRHQELGRWLAGLPEKLLQEDPWLHYYLCQSRTFSGIRQNLKALPKVLEDFRKQGDQRGLLLAQTALILTSFTAGLPWSQIKTYLDQAEALLSETNPEQFLPERAGLLSQFGFTHAVRGIARKAAWACENAYVIARQLGDRRLALNALIHQVDALNFMGDLPEAERKSRVMDELQKSLRPNEAPVLWFVPRSYLHLLKGELEQAWRILDQAHHQVVDRGISYILPVVYLYKLVYAILSEDVAQARALVNLMREDTSGATPPFLKAVSLTLLSMGLHRKGENQEAWEMTDQALEELSTDEARAGTHVASSLVNHALSGRRLGQAADDLVADAMAGREILRDIGSKQLQTEAEFALALASADQGETGDAKLWMKSALNRCQEKGYRYFIIIAPPDLADLVSLAEELGNREAAEWLCDCLAERPEESFQIQLDSLLKNPDPKVQDLALERKRLKFQSRAPRLEITTLNGFTVKVGGKAISKRQWGRKQVRHLLMAIIALGPGGVPREQIMEAMWPEADPEKADQNLRVNLSRLRRALEPEMDQALGSSYVQSENNLLKLNPQKCRLDFQQVAELRAQAAQEEATGNHKTALDLLEQAAALFGGEFLSEEPYLDFCRETRRRLREEHLELLKRIAQLHEQRGSLARAAAAYQKVIQVDPLLETAYQRLMNLQAQLGLYAEAMRTYQECQEQLKENLGAEPGWVTTSLFQKIKDQV